MKKGFLIILILTFTSGFVQAQELGVRFGDIVGNNVAVDGVFGWKASRVHADVSFGSGVGIEALYDFMYNRLGAEAFNYYIGLGVFTWLGSPFQLGVSSELGIEYHFAGVPLALGLDWRPSLRIVDNTDFTVSRFGLNIRFVF